MMKYEVSEVLIWALMHGTIDEYLQKERPEWDIIALSRAAKRRFKEIVKGNEEIGHIWQNPYRMNLNGGALWFAYHEEACRMYPGQMDKDLYAGICNASIGSEKMLGMMTKGDMMKRMKEKGAARDAKVNKIKSPYNWQRTTIAEDDPNAHTYFFTTCGLCALAKRLGHMDLKDPMCKTDYLIAEAAGAVLHRDQTLADGDSCCMYVMRMKGSAAEDRWQKEHEGIDVPVK